MKIKLSKEILGSLPAPDSQGMVRVQATFSNISDGQADLVEINDSPVGGDTDDEAPMPSQDLPDLDAATANINAPGGAPAPSSSSPSLY